MKLENSHCFSTVLLQLDNGRHPSPDPMLPRLQTGQPHHGDEVGGVSRGQDVALPLLRAVERTVVPEDRTVAGRVVVFESGLQEDGGHLVVVDVGTEGESYTLGIFEPYKFTSVFYFHRRKTLAPFLPCLPITSPQPGVLLLSPPPPLPIWLPGDELHKR